MLRFEKKIHLPLIALIFIGIWLLSQIVFIGIYWDAPQYSDASNFQKWALDCYQKGCWYPRAEQFQSEPYICYAGYINFLIAYLHIFDTFKFVPIINLLLNSLQLFALYHISKKICNPTIAHYFVILYCILFSNISIVVPTTSDLFFTTFLFCSIALIREKHLFPSTFRPTHSLRQLHKTVHNPISPTDILLCPLS